MHPYWISNVVTIPSLYPLTYLVFLSPCIRRSMKLLSTYWIIGCLRELILDFPISRNYSKLRGNGSLFGGNGGIFGHGRAGAFTAYLFSSAAQAQQAAYLHPAVDGRVGINLISNTSSIFPPCIYATTPIVGCRALG